MMRAGSESSLAVAIALLAALLAWLAPAFFTAGNLTDILLANLPVLEESDDDRSHRP